MNEIDLDTLLTTIERAEKAKKDGSPWEYCVELDGEVDRAILSSAPALIELAKLLRDVSKILT